MEKCVTMKRTCLFAENKRCTADYKMTCLEALTMTAMIEMMEDD